MSFSKAVDGWSIRLAADAERRSRVERGAVVDAFGGYRLEETEALGPIAAGSASHASDAVGVMAGHEDC